MNVFITLLFGLTILLGTLIVLFTKNDQKIREFSISMAFSVLLFLIFLEFIPESLEHLDYMSFVLFVLIGIIGLKVLDIFIPEHDHSKNKDHISHIGLMACIALILHNIIEGMALYTSLQNNLQLGIMIGIGVGLHNIPMGMIIGSTLKDAGYREKKVIAISTMVSLSTFIGAFLISLFHTAISEYVLGIMLAITLGMIIYIVFFELLEHLKHQDRKTNIQGFILGAIIFLISMLFHSH